jgi:hypothetical protein
MEIEFTVFDDPSITTDGTDVMDDLASELDVTREDRVLYGEIAPVVEAYNMSIRMGWPVSLIRNREE